MSDCYDRNKIDKQITKNKKKTNKKKKIDTQIYVVH